MELVFILYKPAVPENIGAAARALKTMGFRQLRLVDPRADHLDLKSKMLAHGSGELLSDAIVFRTLEECVSDIDFLAGTTAKKRISRVDYLSPGQLRTRIESLAGHIKKAGIIFGTEESGLPNELLQRCDLASSIPLRNPYPSLNLGQAVMLYAYEMSSIEKNSSVQDENEDGASFAELKNRIENLLPQLGIPRDMPLYHRVLERLSQVSSSDINLLHSVSARINKMLGGKENE